MSNREEAQDLQLAFSLHRNEKFSEAAKVYRQIIKRNSRNIHALHSLGVIEAANGNLTEAAGLMSRSLLIQPTNIQFIENYATVLCRLEDYETALEISLKGCRIDKTNKYLLYVSAISFLKLRRLQESLSQFDKILLQEPNQVVAINERSTVLLEMEQYDAALEGIQKAILLDPQFADAHLNKGVLCGQLGRYDEAIVAFQKALTLKPESANAWLGYGKSLFSLHRYDEALNAYGKALSLSSDLENAWLGRGNVLLDLKRFEEALGSYDKALALKPEWAEAWLGRGNVFTELKRYEEAFAAYDKALALKPNLENAWLGRGNILLEFNSIDRALADYQRALEIKKDIFAARVACCLAELQIIYADEHDVISRRTRYQKKLGALNDEVKAGNANGNCKGVFNSRLPFYLAYQGYNDRDLQRLYGSMVCQIMEREFPNLSLTQLAGPDEKIRIGFVSSFFYEHSNWKIPIKGWLGQLDRNRFKVFGYHVGKDRDSETDKAATMCDRFVQRIMSISDWREEILADAPHVLIYPGLFMDQISLQLAAQRLAPVQCNSWGHPDTSGMDTLDYYLSSDLMEPPDANEHYTEKLVRLPNLSIYYEPVPTEPLAISREELGLRQFRPSRWLSVEKSSVCAKTP
jgi:protein O-GlcNAc transferase